MVAVLWPKDFKRSFEGTMHVKKLAGYTGLWQQKVHEATSFESKISMAVWGTLVVKGILAINSEKHLFEYLPDDPIWPIRFRSSRLDSSADIAKASFQAASAIRWRNYWSRPKQTGGANSNGWILFHQLLFVFEAFAVRHLSFEETPLCVSWLIFVNVKVCQYICMCACMYVSIFLFRNLSIYLYIYVPISLPIYPSIYLYFRFSILS